jgi:hypothetical protein
MKLVAWVGVVDWQKPHLVDPTDQGANALGGVANVAGLTI